MMLLSAKTCFKYKAYDKWDEESYWNYIFLKTRKKRGNGAYFYSAEAIQWIYGKYDVFNITISSTQINKILSKQNTGNQKTEVEFFDIKDWDSIVAKILLMK